MSIPRSELSRISMVLYARGFLVLALAAVAVRWPEQTLLSAMVMAGGVVGALGVFELAVAVASEASRPTKTLLVLHALLSMAFGLVAITARLASPKTTMIATTLWLLLHAVLALAIARGIPMSRRRRPVLLAWSAANLLCALLVLAVPGMTLLGVIYLGAVYAAVYGALQVTTALWMRRELRASDIVGPVATVANR